MRPTWLPSGSRIGIVAPSHRWFEGHYTAGKEWLTQHGYEDLVEIGIDGQYRRYAGTDEHRISALNEALHRDDLDAVWILRGGSGLTRILGKIAWEHVTSKPLIGFSDATPLLDAWGQRGHIAIHGPVVHSLSRTDDASTSHLLALLQGDSLTPLAGRELVSGSAHAAIVGGNLCLLAATCGTPHQIDARGKILALEEIGEQPYKIERMLMQLADAGVFAGIAGVALGGFEGCQPPDGATWSLEDIFRDWFGALGVPVVMDLPFGHGSENWAFPVHRPATLRDGALHLGD